jgi:hypothetical protein
MSGTDKMPAPGTPVLENPMMSAAEIPISQSVGASAITPASYLVRVTRSV